MDDLVHEAHAYRSRPPFIIELSKKRLHSTARLIGSMIEAKLTEEALRNSEETFRTTLRSIGDAVISTDMNGLIASINPVAESLTGWSQKETIGQALDTIFGSSTNKPGNLLTARSRSFLKRSNCWARQSYPVDRQGRAGNPDR